MMPGTWPLATAPIATAPPAIIGEFAQLAEDRVLVQMDDAIGSRQFRDFLRELSVDIEKYRDVALEVRDAFDYTTAVGDQQDKIGSIVGLAREGYSDDRYRELMQIQIELLLSAQRDDAQWTGTSESLLRIARAYIGSAGTVNLHNLPPYSFTLSVSALLLADAEQLARFLAIAKYAAVKGHLLVGGGQAWASTSVAVSSPMILGSVAVVVPGAFKWGTTVPIGE